MSSNNIVKKVIDNLHIRLFIDKILEYNFNYERHHSIKIKNRL